MVTSGCHGVCISVLPANSHEIEGTSGLEMASGLSTRQCRHLLGDTDRDLLYKLLLYTENVVGIAVYVAISKYTMRSEG